MATIVTNDDFVNACNYLVSQGQLQVSGVRVIRASERVVYDETDHEDGNGKKVLTDITPGTPTLEAALDNAILEFTTTSAIEIVQANSDSQAASIPAWASWNEAAALAWHDTNITDEFPVGNLTEANALLQTMATENRNMIRMIIAMRNKLWPNLEDNT